MTETTSGWLLNGRVRYTQPRRGYRSGIEPVLLAAAVPARAGQRIIEAGTGAGAGLLCLANRIPGIRGVGIEREASLVTLANENFVANQQTKLRAIAGDITTFDANGAFDHAFANPPWRDESGTAPHEAARARATRGADLVGWIAALARMLTFHGTMTLVLPAASIGCALAAAKEASCGSPILLPFWPKRRRAAKFVLLQMIRAGRSPLRLLPGLTLHRANGAFSSEAERVLREGCALPLSEPGIARPERSARLALGVAQIP